MQTVAVELDKGINLIQARIIDLTNKKITLERDIEHYTSRIELGIERKKIEETKSIIRRTKSRLYEVEKILFLNQQLLGHDDRHEYQLEN
jgi:hypothetical protein